MNFHISTAQSKEIHQGVKASFITTLQSKEKGFALIATILIMVLLLTIAFGLLSLASMSTRSLKLDSAQMEARANARLALMQAIGQLQMTMGSDKRISGRGITMAQHPSLDTSVASNSPQAWWVGAASSDSDETITSDSRSVVWLISGLEHQALSEDQISSPSPFLSGEVTMYGKNSINLDLTGGTDITAGKVLISDHQTGEVSGSYAYFIDDNGMKAQLIASHSKLTETDQNDELGSIIPRSYDPSILNGMEGFDGIPVINYLRILSVNNLPLLKPGNTKLSREKRMSFTTRSHGVLADVKNGRLKRDLTIAFENHTKSSVSKNGGAYPNMPSFPVFDQIFSKNSSSDWGNYLLLDEDKRSEFAENGYIHWAMLRDYYNMKRYIRKQSGYDCLAPVTISETGMHGSLSGFDYAKGIIPPHRMGLNATQGETPNGHRSLPYGDFKVLPSKHGYASEENIEYYKHSPVIPILAELQYNVWMEKAPATPLDGRGNPKDPAVTEALQTNVQMWSSHYNPYNIRLLCSGDRERYSFAAHYMPQAVFRIPGVTIAGQYGHDAGSKNGTAYLQGLQHANEARGYRVEDLEYLDAGRAMMSSFEQDFLIGSGAGNSTMIYGTNVRDLITEKAYRYFNVEGTLPATLDWDISFQDNGSFSHGVQHHSSYTSSQFLWDAYPKNDLPWRQSYEFNDLAPSSYNDNSKLCFNLRLRSTKEAGSSIRPLVDANIRGLFMNRRWDQPLGLEMIAQYTAVDSETDTTLGRVPQMNPQASGKGFGYWGAEHGPFLGHDRVILFDVPREDLVSLGQLQHANVGRFGYEPTYVIGNSYSNPRIPADQWQVTITDTTNTRHNIPEPYKLYDASYLVNEALWDGYVFTTIPQIADNYDDPDEPEPNAEHFAQLLSREKLLPNPRFIPYQPAGSSFGPETLQSVGDGSGAVSSVHYNAGHLLVDGAFNVNSTSVDAWEAFLSGTYGMPYQKVDDNGAVIGFETPDDKKVRFPRVQSVFGQEMTTDSPDENYWVGFRALEQAEVRELAKQIVEEVKARGPFLTMGEFVNRKQESGELGQRGALQAALDKTVNQNPLADYDQQATHPSLPQDSNQAAGFPGQILQGDILQALSPCMTVRSDTFTIRAYGESIDPATGKVVARTWCEATVQRYPDPFVSADDTFLSELTQPTSPFGRSFRIVSFRWLSPSEI